MRYAFVLSLILFASCASTPAPVTTASPKAPAVSTTPTPEPGWIHFVFHPVRGTPHSDLSDDQFFDKMRGALSLYVSHPQTRHELPPEQVGRPIVLRTPRMAIHLPIRVQDTPPTVEVSWCTWGFWQSYLYRGHRVEHVGSCWSQKLSVPPRDGEVIHLPPIRWWTQYDVGEFRQAWYTAGVQAVEQRNPGEIRVFANNLRQWGESDYVAVGETMLGIALILEHEDDRTACAHALPHFRKATAIWQRRSPYLSPADQRVIALTEQMAADCQ